MTFSIKRMTPMLMFGSTTGESGSYSDLVHVTGSVVFPDVQTVTGAVSISGSVFIDPNQAPAPFSIADTTNTTYRARVHKSGALATMLKERPAMYYAITNVQTAANKHMMSIFNASSTQTMRLEKMYLINSQQSSVTGVFSTFEIRRFSPNIHTGGTLVTGEPADTTIPVPSTMTVRTGATVPNVSSVLIHKSVWSNDETIINSQGGEANDHVQQTLNSMISFGEGYSRLVLRQNQGITMLHTTTSTTGVFDVLLHVSIEEAGW